jgi:hypothetical protein
VRKRPKGEPHWRREQNQTFASGARAARSALHLGAS